MTDRERLERWLTLLMEVEQWRHGSAIMRDILTVPAGYRKRLYRNHSRKQLTGYIRRRIMRLWDKKEGELEDAIEEQTRIALGDHY